MKLNEAKTLKKGDLVIYDKRNTKYGGLIFEIEKIDESPEWDYYGRVTLKQPGFNSDFRLVFVNTQMLMKTES